MSILLRATDASFSVNPDGSVTLSTVDAASLAKVTTLASGDFVVMRRVSDGLDVGITIANAVASQVTTISQLPTVVPALGDYLPVFDISGNLTGKVAVSDLQSLSGWTGAVSSGGQTGGTTPSAPVNSAVPTITGTAQVGQTLTASQGTWANSPTSYAYQWKRAGTAISGATSSTYVPVTADVGNALTVTVTAANATGSASSTSAATASVIAAASGGGSSYPALTFSGTAPTFNTATPIAGAASLVSGAGTATVALTGAATIEFLIAAANNNDFGTVPFISLSNGTHKFGMRTSNKTAVIDYDGTAHGDGGSTFRDGAVHHLALSGPKSDGYFSLYLDGNEIDYFQNTWSGDGNYTLSVSVPGNGPVRMDSVRVSKGARYMGTFTPPTAPLARDSTTAALFQFDNQDGTGS